MSRETALSRPRCVVVWLAATTGLATAAALAGDRGTNLPGALRTGTVEQAVVSLAALLLAGCAGWAWLVTTATVGAAWRTGSPPEGRVGALRRLVLAACGLAVVAGTASPATATGDRAREPVPTALLAGLALPDRATSGADVPLRIRPAAESRRTVVVRAGDSLWTLAAATLPRSATPADVDAAWRRLYAANRARIGPDPDVIRPGQRLALPDDPTDQH